MRTRLLPHFKSSWRGSVIWVKIEPMVRMAQVLLLIASLLNCPFHCSGSAGGARAAAGQPSSCSCCASHCEVPPATACETEPVQHDHAPSAPGQCSCADCLCKGAVLTDNASVHDAFLAGLWAVDVTPPPSLLTADNIAVRMDGGSPCPSSIAGRPLRLMVQSLQI